MLQEPKKIDLKSTDPYDCALQLQDILTRTNLAPIMTMVLYEFLDDVLDKRISFDTTIYEHIQNLFEEKLQIFSVPRRKVQERGDICIPMTDSY